MGLNMLLNKHGIWKDTELWESMIKARLNSIYQTSNNHKESKDLINEVQPYKIHNTLRKIAANCVMLELKSTVIESTLKKWGSNIDKRLVKELIDDIKMHQSIEGIAKNYLDIKMKRKLADNTKVLFGISGSIKFFHNYKELVNVLLLNKKMNEELKERVYREVLLRMKCKSTDNRRLELWKHLLKSVIV